MAIREIRLDTDEILRKKSREVSNINDRIKELLDDMAETMKDAEGVGLAAPQVGVLRRIIVIDVGDGLYKMINPEIIKREGSKEDKEACLSVPGYYGIVERPVKISVKYTDEFGDEKTIDAEEMFARAICHEIDHLDGILYVDKSKKMYRAEEND